MSYGVKTVETLQPVARYAARIFAGARLSELPIQGPGSTNSS